MNTKSIYVVIGNSDNRLSQERWAEFIDDINTLVAGTTLRIHGEFYSRPNSKYQNACWSIIIEDKDAEFLQERLSRIARKFQQDAIVWAEAETTFLPKPLEK